jgi:lipoprotein-releasing system permease protein
LSKFQRLNFEYFIAKQISPGKSDNYAKPVVRISYVSIALGLALMIISVSIVIGFKRSISDKIIGFTSHLQITPFDNNESMEERPVTVSQELLNKLNANKHITHIQLSAKKAAVVKTDKQIQGVVFKGVGSDIDTVFLSESLVQGRLPNFGGNAQTDEVLISEKLSKKLEVKVGDDLRAWFVSGNKSQARGRKFKVSGLYNTSLEDFDNVFVIGDLKHVQKLNNWEASQVGTIELMVDDSEHLRDIAFEMYTALPYDLRIATVMDQYPQIYNWLELLDVNVVVILVLMVVVAAITMISTLLILIMERTNMVGVLKALGANNWSVMKIFLYKAAYIVFRGMFWGNVLGLGFYFLQYYFRFVKLSPENYYVDYVPVELSLVFFLALNIGTFLVCLLMLIGPSLYITRIVPSKALRYE